MIDSPESKSDVAPELSSSESVSSDSTPSFRSDDKSSVSPVESEPQSYSGKPMNDPEHNIPQRDAGNPPDPTLPTPNQSPVQPSAKEILVADSEQPHIDMGVRHAPGPVKHNPGAGTVEEGVGEYSSESGCPDVSYLAGDCDRSDSYYRDRGLRTREEMAALRRGESPAPVKESK